MEEAMEWYAGGLGFACTRCGRCCSGKKDGYVWVTLPEIVRLAERLGLGLDAFGRAYLRRVGARYALLEHHTTGDCIFLREAQCAVYEARPVQCRTFPFWPTHLASPEAWRQAATECEGIKDDARCVPFAEIQAAGASTGDDAATF